MAYRLNAASKKRLVLGAGAALLAVVLLCLPVVVFPAYGHLVVLAIAAALVSAGVWQRMRYARIRKWVPVAATVLEIGENWIDVILHYSALRHHFPVIRYEYAFQGVSYVSNAVSLDVESIWVPEVDGWGVKTDDALKFWHGWTAGTAITAYVNAGHPSEAVIVNKIGKKKSSQQMALIVAGVMVGALWVFLVYP